MPEFKFNMDFVPIPKDFIENAMPTANPAYVKVYLYIMLLATNNKSLSTADIGKHTGLIESDVVNAITYWKEKGIFSGTSDTIIIKKTPDEEVLPTSTKKSIDEVSSLIDNNSELSDLCTIAQEILGKTLANNDLETLYWFYDQLGFSAEIITMLLEYCVSRGKRNMNYIEKVAITWHENKITTIAEAQAYISSVGDADNYVSSLKSLFGITDRKLSKTENAFMKSWREDLNMSVEMVGLAYEYCIIAINKLSFPYMNTIIKRWAEQGISTIAEAEADHEKYKQDSSSGGTQMSATENISELEKQFMSSYEDA